jgi:hypothetical protein
MIENKTAHQSALRLSNLCLAYATCCVIVGMCLGIWMGIREDHTLGPVHAHLNVIGWVSVAIIGLYHRGAGHVTSTLDRLQAFMLMAGVPAFSGGLGVFLSTTNPTVERIVFPIGLAGTFLCLAAMVMFLAMILRDRRRMA